MSAPHLPDQLQRKLDTLPEGPGVYLWKDAAGDVLYVGKAKRLRNRVRSYFAVDFPTSPRNQLLQRLIADVETIVVPSEAQSLILENNLIKEYRPRFNVRLKADKSYPSIAVTLNEPFPRVLVTRRRALSQLVGFLLMDNGITAVGFLTTTGVGLVVELGVSLDVLLAVLVLQVLTTRMRETFGDTDLDELRELRD